MGWGQDGFGGLQRSVLGVRADEVASVGVSAPSVSLGSVCPAIYICVCGVYVCALNAHACWKNMLSLSTGGT